MPLDLTVLARQVEPEKTTLILGAGVSIPSGAPSGQQLRDELGHEFGIEGFESFDLADLCTIIESKRERFPLIQFVRKRIAKLQPTGGLLSLPLFEWGGIFSTNYDDLVEKAYKRSNKPLRVISTNHDFHGDGLTNEQVLYKFHGTIDKDVATGENSRLILTSTDYDQVTNYRELLYARLRDSLFSKSVLIVGQSLVDPDLRGMVDEAQRLKSNANAPGRIQLLVFQRNDDLATVFEARGLTVSFGGIDDFSDALIKASPSEQLVMSVTTDVLGAAPQLEPGTFSVATERVNQTGHLQRMFSGRSANYADIARGWTFERDLVGRLETQHVDDIGAKISVILGVAGVGKSTAARVVLSRLSQRELECWEHKLDFALDVNGWLSVNNELARRKKKGVLFIDEAHRFLRSLNILIEKLSVSSEWALELILVSSRPHWNPRLKTAELYKNCKEHELSRLSSNEINGLLDLLEGAPEIRELVEDNFLGFRRPERFDRLKERCDADMFVCMKNIFGFQGIDTIILEEFASLEEDLQEIYRVVSGMQSIGARVHRELVRRLTGLQADNIQRVLDDLRGIVEEYTVSIRDGIYGWRVRHPVIATTLAKYKYSDQGDLYQLFDDVVTHINPAYKFEAQSVNEMCDLETGITRISDRQKQNILLRRMISAAPSLRVPRHRLIHNLIKLDHFDVAETEIRIFERELSVDPPIQRYKVRLKLGLARRSEGIQDQDRAALVNEASAMAQKCIERFPDDKNMYRVYLETGVEWFRYTGKAEVFEEAMRSAAEAQQKLLDPELRQIITRFVRAGEEMGIQVY